MGTAEQLLTIAQGYLGTKDGDNFVRKYNQYTGIGIPLGSFWCAMFVSVIARMAGVPTTEIPNYHGCTTGTKTFKSLGRWRDRTSGYIPKPGDVILFDWNPAAYDGIDHTGFVERVQDGRVYTIEGNAGNQGVCMRKDYALTSTLIAGYGTPVYDVVTAPAPTPAPETNKAITEDDEMIYKTLKEIPGAYKPTIQKMMEKKILLGHDEKKPEILTDNILDVSETFCRMAVILDRQGIFDK